MALYLDAIWAWQICTPSVPPSRSALEMMAESRDFKVAWADWASLTPEQRTGVSDYFPDEDRKLLRATAILRPKG